MPNKTSLLSFLSLLLLLHLGLLKGERRQRASSSPRGGESESQREREGNKQSLVAAFITEAATAMPHDAAGGQLCLSLSLSLSLSVSLSVSLSLSPNHQGLGFRVFVFASQRHLLSLLGITKDLPACRS